MVVSAYNRFMAKYRKKGYSMEQVAVMWNAHKAGKKMRAKKACHTTCRRRYRSKSRSRSRSRRRV